MDDCDDLEQLLVECGLRQYLDAFREQKILKEHIAHMEASDFYKLGLTIGDRLNLQQKCCKEPKEPGTGTATISERLATLIKQRTGGRQTSKDSVTLYVGWNHRGRLSRGFRKVTGEDGGGGRGCKVTVPKTCTYPDLLKLLENQFFPGGISKSGMILQGTSQRYVGRYGGETVDTVGFTMGSYKSTTPIRLYLFTEEGVYRYQAAGSAPPVTGEREQWQFQPPTTPVNVASSSMPPTTPVNVASSSMTAAEYFDAGTPSKRQRTETFSPLDSLGLSETIRSVGRTVPTCTVSVPPGTDQDILPDIGLAIRSVRRTVPTSTISVPPGTEDILLDIGLAV